VFTGAIAVRDRLELRGEEQKVTAVAVFEAGTTIRREVVTAGRIARLHGLHTVRIGDLLGVPPPDRALSEHHFAPPTLETVVLPQRDSDRGRLRVALDQLAEQDPLIDLRQDDLRHELYVSLYGEVQKEVIGSTLETEYGLQVGFRESTTICVERVTGSGTAVERNTDGRSDEQPFLATLGLRVDPAPLGSGISFRLEVELGSMPYAFFRAVEETVPRVLQQGLSGWQVPDAVVTMTANGYWPRQSAMHATFDRNISTIANDFRYLTPLVLMEALQRAGTQVLEPIHRFRLEIPDDLLGTVAPAIGRLGGVLETSVAQGTAYLLEGLIPAARVHELQQALPGLTRGEGVLDLEFDSYQPVRGPAPTRPRTDHNPLDRKEYLLHTVRKI
jgi:ribosomal protection tetracycline resistance protein